MQGKDTPHPGLYYVGFCSFGCLFRLCGGTIPLIPLGVALALALAMIALWDFISSAPPRGRFCWCYHEPLHHRCSPKHRGSAPVLGIGYRVVCFLVFFVIAAWFILRYARSCKGDPSKSIFGDTKKKKGKWPSTIWIIPCRN